MTPIKVLFICHGNICRSPTAEFVMKELVRQAGLSDEFYIESRATSTEEIWNGRGNPIYEPARKLLREHGIPYDEKKRATLLTHADYEHFDLLIAMDARNLTGIRRILGEGAMDKVTKLRSYSDGRGDIDDPWYTDDYEGVYRQIEDGCRGLMRTLTER